MTYSIMQLDVEHINEICNDIKEQYEQGICDCVLFCIRLVPEGNPVIDKAEIQMRSYDSFRDKLADMGMDCGVLIQCSIGHGYPLNQSSPFVQVEGLTLDKRTNITCPYDENFREYMYKQAQIIAKHKPRHIMLDDDFRLIERPFCGCVCELHRKAFNELTGETVTTAEEIRSLIIEKSLNQKKYEDAFKQVQKDSLLGAAKYIRAGIDSVNPKIQGSFCCCGLSAENGGAVAKIMAGKGNPVILRLNNGRYCVEGGKMFSNVAYRFAQQKEYVKKDVDYILAETDTCPQNRYSTPAVFLHSHYVLSILEGAQGAKHWITRLNTYEPNSGKAYRKTLSKYKGMYQALMKINGSIQWKGCRIPLFKESLYGVTNRQPRYNDWSSYVLERLGLPIYYSAEKDGVVFIDESSIDGFTDEDLLETLKGNVVFSGTAAKIVQDKGFGKYLGVGLVEWKGVNLSGEIYTDTTTTSKAQLGAWELRIESDKTKVLSQMYHLHNGEEIIPLFPSVTSYQNELGGNIVVFCGTPKTPFTYTDAFAMLCETRKEQMVKILKESGNLPLYYKDEGDLLLKVGELPSGELLCAVFDLNFDPLENIAFGVEKDVISVRRMTANGEEQYCDFEMKDKVCTVNSVIYPMQPAIFFIKCKDF